MAQLFLDFLNRSIQASVLVVVVVLMRFLLKKSPKWVHCLMWGMVAIRLICPFSLESAYSLAPEAEVVQTDISEGRTQIQSGIPAIDRPANAYLESHYTVKSATSMRAQAFHPQSLIAVIWIVGMIALASYAAHSYRKLRKRVQESDLLQGNTYLCDRIQTPFILGVIKPHIYLPSNLTDEQLTSVLAHEQAHLKRGDHLWKPLGYLLLALYWFNPFCWIAYILLCRDIEMACDEKVIRDMDLFEKKVYSRVILSFSTPGKMISACPLAFGEVGVKQRIRAVLNYKKPAFWVIVLAAVAILVTAVCFMTNPLSKEGDANTILLTNESSIGNAEAQSGVQTEEELKRQLALTEQNKMQAEMQEAVLLKEQAEAEKQALRNRKFIVAWATAFCSRDGQTIATLSSESVKASLEQRELLEIGEEYASFGFSSPWPMWAEDTDGFAVIKQDDAHLKAEILYYALTSDPHVTVWKETITFAEQKDSFVVTKEELSQLNYIASGMEFDEVYSVINGTLMDYTTNGLAEALAGNAMLSSSTLRKKLQNPVDAARILLNLLDNPNKVSICPIENKDANNSERVDIEISFKEDGMNRLVTMVKLDDRSGIWVPQDYEGEATSPEETSKNESEFDVLSEVVSNIGLENAYAWNNTVEFKENADVLIKMASDETGEYEVYGIMSAEYGAYGLLLNDRIDGEDNWNFVYEPWFYTGTPDDTPVLQKSADGEYTFSYVYDVKDGAAWWKDGIIDCGYETGHMELRIIRQYNKTEGNQTNRGVLQNSKKSDGTPSRAYVESLQEKISTDMASGKLPFVVASSVMENPLRLEVRILEMSEENIDQIHSYETNGNAIAIVMGDGIPNLEREENMGVSYEETENGQYVVEGDMVLQYKKVLTGRMPGAEKDSRFIVLTNDNAVTFEQVAKSIYSSSSPDWLPGTIIIGMHTIE